MPLHDPSVSDDEPENLEIAARNTRYGLVLFTMYCVVYAIYVLLNAFWAEAMEWRPVAGLNLAVLYGFGLIFGALLLSLVYGWLCRANSTPQGGGK